MLEHKDGYVLGAIFARGGSKGVPRKNVRSVAGRPLIAYSIEAALASRYIERVVVSTDDPEIAATSLQFGAEVPFLRPAELARDNSPEWLAWRHMIESLTSQDQRSIGVFVSIPPTSPLRAVEDIDACIKVLQETDADVVITVRPAARSPYFNMVSIDQTGYARLVIPPTDAVHRRQAAPLTYDITTVAYAARPKFVLEATSIFAGKVRTVLVPEERALDIDTEYDIRIADFLLRERLTQAAGEQ